MKFFQQQQQKKQFNFFLPRQEVDKHSLYRFIVFSFPSYTKLLPGNFLIKKKHFMMRYGDKKKRNETKMEILFCFLFFIRQ